jgi:hypothetical protein
MIDPDERAKIEHELGILRARYALMQKWARITKWFVIASCVVIAVIVIYAVSTGDALEIALTVLTVLIVAMILPVFWRVRWIDLISGLPAGLTAFGSISEARSIEIMIAEREQRLREWRPA